MVLLLSPLSVFPMAEFVIRKANALVEILLVSVFRAMLDQSPAEERLDGLDQRFLIRGGNPIMRCQPAVPAINSFIDVTVRHGRHPAGRLTDKMDETRRHGPRFRNSVRMGNGLSATNVARGQWPHSAFSRRSSTPADSALRNS